MLICLQEWLLSLLGSILFLVVSFYTYQSYADPQFGAPQGKLLAGLCLATAATLAINFVLLSFTLFRK